MTSTRWKALLATTLVSCGLFAAEATPAIAAPPANDNFSNATTLPSLTSVTIGGSNVEATSETEENTCCFVHNSVWYRWTAPKTGNYRLELCASSFNTHVKVATGTAVNALEVIVDNDDDPGCGADGKRSRLTFIAGAGQEYKLQVGSENKDVTGAISGSLSLVSPSNDFFADATGLGSGSTATITGRNIDASTEQGEPTCCSTSATVWYRWTAPAPGTYRVETCASDFKTYLKVLQGTAVSGLETLAENGGAAGCGSAGDRAATSFTAGANATYYIQIGSAAELRGNISGSISPVSSAPTPPRPPARKRYPKLLPPSRKPPVLGGGVQLSKGRYVLKVKGSLKRPPGYTRAQACNGTISLRIKKGKKPIAARKTLVNSKCGYAKTIRISPSKVGKAKKLNLTVRFEGNDYLGATERTYKIAVKR